MPDLGAIYCVVHRARMCIVFPCMCNIQRICAKKKASPGTVGWDELRRVAGVIQDEKLLDLPGQFRL